jgi:hypothetical protein
VPDSGHLPDDTHTGSPVYYDVPPPPLDDDQIASYLEESYPDDSYLDEVYNDGPAQRTSSTHRSSRRSPRTSRSGQMADAVFSTFCNVLAATDGSSASQFTSLISQIRVSDKALDELDDARRRILEGVLELVEFEITVLSPESPLVLDDCSAVPFAADDVKAALDTIVALDTATLPENPMGAWVAVCNEVQSRRTRRMLDHLASAIDGRRPASEQLQIFDRLEPPAPHVAVVREEGIRTVDKLLEDLEESGASLSSYRLPSGFPTLDATQTGEGDEIGLIAPGENLLILGPTGTGKSSIEYALHRGTTLALTQLYPDALSILAHTEEESRVKATAIGLKRGQRWHFLAKNIVIENIGSSRRRLAELFFDTIAHAIRRSQETGRHPIEFVCHKMHIDYIQAIGEQGENEQVSVINTSELILRGFQACNPEEIEKYSNVNFTRYTGMKWPEELEHHRVAVITYGQLRKSGSDSVMFFDPSNKKHSISQFALEDPRDEPTWSDPSGNKWCWEVNGGDFRLFTKDDIYGSSKPLQNATSVLLLHRSRPQKNPVGWRDEFGRPHLVDTRARLILDKARNGQQALYVPMAFDVMPDGFRAQYYDVVAENLVRDGLITVDEFYQQPGDPMIPKRPPKSPFVNLRY